MGACESARYPAGALEASGGAPAVREGTSVYQVSLSARAGFTRAARIAGMPLARVATAARPTAARAMVVTSCGCTPNRSVAMNLEIRTLRPSPATIPERRQERACQDEADYVQWSCAERHANPDLGSTPRGGARGHAVKAEAASSSARPAKNPDNAASSLSWVRAVATSCSSGR